MGKRLENSEGGVVMKCMKCGNEAYKSTTTEACPFCDKAPDRQRWGSYIRKLQKIEHLNYTKMFKILEK